MLNNPKRIALVYDAIFPFIKGGAEKRFYEIGKRLAQEGNDVHLYGMKSWEGKSVIEYEGMTLHGVCRNYPLYTDSGRRSIFQAIMFGLAVWRLWKEPFDVIDCCGFPYFSLFPLRLITWVRGKKLYSTWHEVWGLEYWKKYLGLLGIFGYIIERCAVLLPDTIISVSDGTSSSIMHKLGRKNNVVVIPNGLDIDKIKDILPAAEKSDLIYVGRLIAHKNIDMLVRATGLLVKNNPELLLMIVGDGPERKNIEKLVAQLQIGKNVRFVGFVEDHDEVLAYMHASKVFVLPSTREGFGIVVIEANTCGLPVITTDHRNNAAKDLIIKDENGIACKSKETLFAEKISLMLKVRKEQLHYQKYANPYDWNVILPVISRTYFSS